MISAEKKIFEGRETQSNKWLKRKRVSRDPALSEGEGVIWQYQELTSKSLQQHLNLSHLVGIRTSIPRSLVCF